MPAQPCAGTGAREPAPTSTASRQRRCTATIVCPYADCAQPNPPGSERCVYCNRPLTAPSRPPSRARGRCPRRCATTIAWSTCSRPPAAKPTSCSSPTCTAASAASSSSIARASRPDFRLLDILAQTVGDTRGARARARHVRRHRLRAPGIHSRRHAGGAHARGPAAEDRHPAHRQRNRRCAERHPRASHPASRPQARERADPLESPLELALTDFGIASLTAATQHFTSVARTTKYAAPEALTGVLDAKSDWWSLGMIVLEAASGRHPFDGLNEQVMNHQLATRPSTCAASTTTSCACCAAACCCATPSGGGAATRSRAGSPAIRRSRWRKTPKVRQPSCDPTASARRKPPSGPSWRSRWPGTGTRRASDLARGQVARWLEQELHDYNLVRVLRDIQEQKGSSDDARLLRFLLAAAPDLPPVWRGSPVTADAVLASARAAANGDNDAQAWLDSLYRDDGAADVCRKRGTRDCGDLDLRWRAGWKEFVELWDAACRAEEEWRQAPRDVGGGAAACRELSTTLRSSRPAARAAAATSDQRRAAAGARPMRRTSTRCAAKWPAASPPSPVTARGSRDCGRGAQRRPVGVLVAQQLLPHAQDDARDGGEAPGGHLAFEVAAIRGGA